MIQKEGLSVLWLSLLLGCALALDTGEITAIDQLRTIFPALASVNSADEYDANDYTHYGGSWTKASEDVQRWRRMGCTWHLLRRIGPHSKITFVRFFSWFMNLDSPNIYD